MGKKLIVYFCIIYLLGILLTGCSSALKKDNDLLSNEINSLKQQNAEMEKELAQLKAEKQVLNKRLEEHETKDALSVDVKEGSKDNLHIIYTADIYNYSKKADFYVYISPGNSLEEKLNILTKVLSETYFGSLPIDILTIEKVDSKNIAVLNLKESEINKGITDFSKLRENTWATGYLQGSAGGAVTTTTLTETLLQRDYEGDWIDGVKFLYNGKPMDFEHVPDLCNVSYR